MVSLDKLDQLRCSVATSCTGRWSRGPNWRWRRGLNSSRGWVWPPREPAT